MQSLRIGIVGLGANTKLRHVPGLRACPDVEIVGVCNRSPESTRRAAEEFAIPKQYAQWQDLLADADVDAVVIGTWPYLHAPITIAALQAGKHVLTEARMAMNLEEARRMLEASRARPDLVAQIVPSPFGLRADRVVKELLAGGFIGRLREFVVLGTHNSLADPATPLHWRQKARYSGVNMLTLGILHETLTRWIADPECVLAQTQTFTPKRLEAETKTQGPVETPDSAHVLTQLPGGAQGIYHFSGVLHHGPGSQIHLYGSEGTLKYLLAPEDRLLGATRAEAVLKEIPVPADKAGGWRVEAEFVAAIRGEQEVLFTSFESGLRYMRFTDAVARSAASGSTVSLA
jgi:predicted dehydrogenase